MRILVVAATKHESTGEIADAVAAELRSRGHDVRREPVAEATGAGADAVVLGSAVYMGRWMADARAFASRHADRLTELPVWLFSVGLAGTEADDPATVEPDLVADIAPVGAVAFAGRVHEAVLGLRERSVVPPPAPPRAICVTGTPSVPGPARSTPPSGRRPTRAERLWWAGVPRHGAYSYTGECICCCGRGEWLRGRRGPAPAPRPS